ncbi:MAG TPA: hypothetical protein VGC14_10650 [Rhizobium sp.]
MQLIDTHVGNTNDGMMNVEFRGEGGELVSVTMAEVAIERDAAINRAKAMMVQLTAFADDRDPPQDRPDQFQDAESGKRSSEPSEARSEATVVSSFGDAPSSAA